MTDEERFMTQGLRIDACARAKARNRNGWPQELLNRRFMRVARTHFVEVIHIAAGSELATTTCVKLRLSEGTAGPEWILDKLRTSLNNCWCTRVGFKEGTCMIWFI